MLNLISRSPFNFKEGIPQNRLVKGRNTAPRDVIIQNLKCSWCNKIAVEGQECTGCQKNFCWPCLQMYNTTQLAGSYPCPSKCSGNFVLRNMNKNKLEMLESVKFRCIRKNCIR